MKRFRVVIPATVQSQIRAQAYYIAQDSVPNALAWESRLRNAVQRLGDLPGGRRMDREASALACTFISSSLNART